MYIKSYCRSSVSTDPCAFENIQCFNITREAHVNAASAATICSSTLVDQILPTQMEHVKITCAIFVTLCREVIIPINAHNCPNKHTNMNTRLNMHRPTIALYTVKHVTKTIIHNNTTFSNILISLFIQCFFCTLSRYGQFIF